MPEHSSHLLPPLNPDEEIIYEGPSAVLTNRRLMANFGPSADGGFDEALLTDIAPPKKQNGGKYSNKQLGVKLLVAGAVVLVVEILLERAAGLDPRIEALVFLAGTLATTVGLYIIIGGLFQVKPNTTLVFPKVDGGHIVVPFRDWDSPDAEELRRQFARAKRGF